MRSCVSVFFIRSWEQRLFTYFSSLWRVLHVQNFHNSSVYVVLLRTILSSSATVADEACKWVGRWARSNPMNIMAPHPLTSLCQWQLSVTVGTNAHPTQHLSQFQISLNTIKQCHPQDRASITLDHMMNFTYNTLWNPPNRLTYQPQCIQFIEPTKCTLLVTWVLNT
jgi:hypothetical protein